MGKKILIIDDEENIRNLLKSMLYDYGKIYEADFGKKGMLLFQQEKPDIILLDIMLPDTSGVELLQQIREKDKNVKIIMITAYETIKSVIDIMDIEISGYITKPFVVKDVIQNISKILNNN